MDALTRSSSEPNRRAQEAVVVGLLSVAAMPIAIGITHFAGYDVINGGFAIPVGLALGIAAIKLARSARRLTERTIGRIGGSRGTRLGRLLGALGVYLALAAALSIGVYELLNYLSG